MNDKRIEKKTVSAMIEIYCRKKHGNKHLCHECLELGKYAEKRLESCPYKEKKPACSQCTTHCYNRNMREQIRKVMRYSGPKMMIYHPILAIDHLLKTLK